MGSIFPLILVLLGFCGTSKNSYGQILLPEEPRTHRFPGRSQEAKDKDYEERARQLDEKLSKDKTLKSNLPETTPALKRDRELLKAALTPAPMEFALHLSLLLPYLRTAGTERERYQADPSVGVHVFYRPFKARGAEETNFWTGFRLNYFQGTGAYKDNHGTFSFGYFGPMIGVGKISPSPQSAGEESFKDEKAIDAALSARHGFFLLGGIAGQTRQGTYEDEKEVPEDDFNNKGVTFDPPGLWSEVWYTNINYNAFSYNSMLGVQLGKQKTFIYLGFGVGGWN